MTHDPHRVDGREATKRFAELTYDRFREMAQDSRLSSAERIGYPDALRSGFEAAVLDDLRSKLPALALSGSRILDIGAGCGELARRIIEQALALQQTLVMVDSAEMLSQLPEAPVLAKVAGRFPEEVRQRLSAALPEGADAIICYGVLQVVFLDANPFTFVDRALSLLAPGGRLLLGEIPNVSKLRRFLASDAGAAFHRAYMRTEEAPEVPAFAPPGARIDDGFVLGLLHRIRNSGYDAYLLPQPAALPFANRREDLLVIRP